MAGLRSRKFLYATFGGSSGHKTARVHYSFGFTADDTRAHCREAYINAEAVLQHLADVDAAFKAVAVLFLSTSEKCFTTGVCKIKACGTK